MIRKHPAFAALALLATSTAAWADGAPATVDSDVTPVTINAEVKNAPIDTRTRKFEARASVGNHSSLGTTARAEGAVGKKFVVGYDDHAAVGLGLYLGGTAKADFARPGDRADLQNLQLRALSVSPLAIHVDDRPYGSAPADAHEALPRRACYDADRDAVDPVCLQIFPSYLREDFERELADCAARHSTLGHCGESLNQRITQWYKRQHLLGEPQYIRGGRELSRVRDPRPSLTGSIKFIDAQLVHDDQKSLRSSATGARINFAEASGHVGFRFGGLPVDVCAQASFGYTLGAIRAIDAQRTAAVDAEGRACAGVQLGQAGRLGYDYRIGLRGVPTEGRHEGPTAWSVNQSHEVSLRRIAGTPLMVAGSYETAQARSPDTYGPDKKVTKAGSALDTSAQFVTVGAEF